MSAGGTHLRRPHVARATADEAAAGTAPVLEVTGLTNRFGGISAVNDVSFTLRESEILGLIGPNGAGKTTIFDMICGHLPTQRGRIVLARAATSATWAPERRAAAGLGRSFQDARIFPSLTVAENIALGLERHIEVRDHVSALFGTPAMRESEVDVAFTVDDLIELMGLGAFRDKFVGELSTGSRRIVDLAMSIAHDPKVLLLDEPVERHRAARDRGARPAAAAHPRGDRLRDARHRARHAAHHARCRTPSSRSSSARCCVQGHAGRGARRPARRRGLPRRRPGRDPPEQLLDRAATTEGGCVMAGTGRHRAEPAPRRTARRVAVGTLFVAAATVFGATWPTAAQADAPVQTAWWNAASGGGQAAPEPTAEEGGLHLAVEPGQILAFGAVLYAMPVEASGTLELKIGNIAATPQVNPTAPTTDPAVNIQACPTADTSWKAGDNQPMDSAPDYDCSLRSFTGSVSADGTSVTFLVDGSAETVPGQLSLAIVPVMTTDAPGVGTQLPTDATQPYSVDISKPDAGSLVLTGGTALPAAAPAPASAPPAPAGTTTGAATAAGSAAGPPGAPAAPDLSLPAATTTSTGAQTPPVVAGSAAPAAPAAAPAAAVTPASDNTAHNAALAMLIVLGTLIVAGSNNQVQQRAPRLLGGAGRRAGLATAGGSAAAVTAAAPAPAPGYGSRGLGRFAKPRTAPPRPLI